MFLQESDQVFAWNATVLRSRNAIASEATGIKPLVDGAGCNLADLCYLPSSEDCSHFLVPMKGVYVKLIGGTSVPMRGVTHNSHL